MTPNSTGFAPDAAPGHNRLIAAVPAAVRATLMPLLEPVDLKLGDVLYESGVVQQHVYFPIDCIVSLLYVLEDGQSAEIAVVGFEGMVGVSLVMGGGSTPNRAVVQSAGRAWRLGARHFGQRLEQSGPLLHLLLRYTQALITQISQTAACYRHHSIEQQLRRWLLLTHDRMPTGELVITQELIANMLGVRREGVTEAAGKLQRLDLIKYARGHITVLDRPGLERRVCECYSVVKRETDRLLPREAAL